MTRELAQETTMSKTLYDFSVKTIDGKDKSLGDYRGNVVLIVNVASACGYTPQYDALEKLHEKYASKGLRVLGFPSNDFGAQEPGTEAEIKTFCETKFGVKFDMFAKLHVTGEQMAPLYDWLQSAETNPKFSGPVPWNFNKFLIGGDGTVVGRFIHKVDPMSGEVRSAIEKALAG
jgi:glutathione peroxidase